MERARCPYCFSTINGEADVCRYCARDVKRLLKAEARVQVLEAREVTPISKADGQDPVFTGLVILFYTSTTALYWFAITYSMPDLIKTPVWTISVLAAAALVLVSRACNVGRFFSLGFAQPVLSLAVLTLFGWVEIDELAPLAPMLFREALQVGAVVAAGGSATAYLTRVLPKQRQVTLQWHSLSSSEIERWEKIALRVAAVATPLISLLSLFGGGSQ